MQRQLETVPSDTTFSLRTSLTASNDNPPVGDIDQGPSMTATFHQRRSDVFASLAGLEVAHGLVIKDTKPERDALRKTVWRRPETAPENLEAQKKQRDRRTSPAPSDQPPGEFRRPQMPPVSQHHRRRLHNEASRAPRDPDKWTHYSLRDVDEDSSQHSDFAIAASFLSKRRTGDDGQPDDNEDLASSQPRRLLFRPTRGSKRPRQEIPDSAHAMTSRQHPVCLSTENEPHEAEDDDDEEEEIHHHSSVHDSDVLMADHGSPHFRSRRQRGQMRARQQLPETSDDLQQLSEKSHTEEPEIDTDKPLTDNEIEELDDDDVEDCDDADQSSDFLA